MRPQLSQSAAHAGGVSPGPIKYPANTIGMRGWPNKGTVVNVETKRLFIPIFQATSGPSSILCSSSAMPRHDFFQHSGSCQGMMGLRPSVSAVGSMVGIASLQIFHLMVLSPQLSCDPLFPRKVIPLRLPSIMTYPHTQDGYKHETRDRYGHKLRNIVGH